MSIDTPAIQPSLRGRTVLIVEDHDDSLEMLTMSLQLIGATVHGAKDVSEAQRVVSGRRPDLIICDLHLHTGGSGIEFIGWLRSLPARAGGKTPAVALTGRSDMFPPSTAHGFSAYMRKPVDMAKLCNTVAGLLGGSTQTQPA